MLDYKFLSDISKLEGKTISKSYLCNHSGEQKIVISTTEDEMFSCKFSNGRVYDMDYVHEEIYSNIVEVFEALDHELIGFITEEEYEEMVRQEEEKYEIEEKARLESQKKRKYADYLKLKKEFEGE